MLAAVNRRKSKIILLAVIVFFNPLFLGLLFAVLPCYLLPDIGSMRWCGYKSEPPYFIEQFVAGALTSVLLIGYLVYSIRKRDSLPSLKSGSHTADDHRQRPGK